MNNEQMIETLAALPGDIAAAFAAVDDKRSVQPLDDGWTPREILGHLKDAAAIYDERISRVASEDNPYLLNVDQDEAVARGNYNSADPSTLLSELAEHRRNTIEVLRSLNDADWNRPGVHSERGPLTLRSLVEYMVEHETDHVADIRRAAGKS